MPEMGILVVVSRSRQGAPAYARMYVCRWKILPPASTGTRAVRGVLCGPGHGDDRDGLHARVRTRIRPPHMRDNVEAKEETIVARDCADGDCERGSVVVRLRFLGVRIPTCARPQFHRRPHQLHPPRYRSPLLDRLCGLGVRCTGVLEFCAKRRPPCAYTSAGERQSGPSGPRDAGGVLPRRTVSAAPRGPASSKA